MTYECLSSVIFHGLCFEFRAGPLDSEPYRSAGQCFHPCGHFASAAALTSVHCARVPELLEQPVTATFRPSFVRKFFSQLSRIISQNWYKFLIRILSSSLKTMFINNAVTYDVWVDVTSDCQIKYVKSLGHVINSGTILVREHLQKKPSCATTWDMQMMLAKTQQISRSNLWLTGQLRCTRMSTWKMIFIAFCHVEDDTDMWE